MLRRWCGLSPFLLLACFGCNLGTQSFAGTVIQMTLTGPSISPIGQHLELWARDQYNDVIRLNGTYDYTPPGSSHTTRLLSYGFAVRPAITMDDPCMIDGAGHLLTKAEAYAPSTVAGVEQNAEEQAQQVRSRIAQLTATTSCDGSGQSVAYHCGHEPSTLLGVVAYELLDGNGDVMSQMPMPPTTCETSGNAAGCIPYDAPPDARLAACQAYWARSPLAYTPNPLQITSPAHGVLYGELTYVTTTPPSAFDSIRIDSSVGDLAGIQELWVTTEPDHVDPDHRGPILVQGTPDAGGIDVLHFDLAPPPGATVAASGTAALLVNLNQDPAQF